LEVVAKAIHLFNFYSGSSVCPATVWMISGLQNCHSSESGALLLEEHCSRSAALGFHECGSGSSALFFHGSGPNFGFCSFSHINILIVLVFIKLNGK